MAIVGWGWAPKGWLPSLWISHKVTKEQWQSFWDRQAGKCAGCRRDLAHPLLRELKTGEKPQVDSSKLTGKARGLLCAECAGLLLKVQRNAETLRELSRYLAKSEETLYE